jgi:chromosome segregation ATPase
LLIARNSASRDKKAFEDERATWERERGHASRDSAEQAANLKQSCADVQALKKRVAAAESNATTSASDRVRAEQESNDLRAKVKELECQIADEKLEAEEARNEVEGLRSLLYQLEDAAATQRKKMKESSEIAKRRKRSEHAYVPEKL